jgi:hypothetical protein
VKILIAPRSHSSSRDGLRSVDRERLTGRSHRMPAHRKNLQRRAARFRMRAMSAESRLVGAALTALLHLLVLWVLLRVAAGTVAPPQPPALQTVSAERLRDAGEQRVEVDIRPQLATRRGRACDGSSYVGVGITADPRTDRIVLVGENTPAARAGLRHDDIVLNPMVWQHAHVDGALLLVRVLRAGGPVTLPVIVGRICIE